MAAWYCLLDGQEVGPWSSAQLRQLARSGRLRPGDRVRLESGDWWSPASKVRGLFPNSPAAAAAALPTAIPLPAGAAPPAALPVATPLACPVAPVPPAVSSPSAVAAPGHGAAAAWTPPAFVSPPVSAGHRGSREPRGAGGGSSRLMVGGLAAALVVGTAALVGVWGRPSAPGPGSAASPGSSAPGAETAAAGPVEADPGPASGAAQPGPTPAPAAGRPTPEVTRWLEAGKQRRIVRDVMRLHVPAVWWSADGGPLVVEVEIENLSPRGLEFRGWVRRDQRGEEQAVIYVGDNPQPVPGQPAAVADKQAGPVQLSPGQILRQRLRFPVQPGLAGQSLRMVLPYAAVAQSGAAGFLIPAVSILSGPPDVAAPVAAPPDPAAATARQLPADESQEVEDSEETGSMAELRRSIEASGAASGGAAPGGETPGDPPPRDFPPGFAP